MMAVPTSTEKTLLALVAELRKHKAPEDSILKQALMVNRQTAKPWPEDRVRMFLRTCEAGGQTKAPPQPNMSALNIVVRSEVVGGEELKDFDAIVRERAASAAERQAILREATASQRMVRRPTPAAETKGKLY